MTNKLDMVKARNLAIISVIAAGLFAGGLALTTNVKQQEKIEGVDVAQVYSGRNTSFILDNDGQLWGKGVNNVGQLGVGDYSNKSEWTQVVLPEEAKVDQAAIGRSHGAALTDSRHIYTFGDNRTGIQGNGTTSISLSPQQVVASYTYSKIASGDGFVLAIDTDGVLHSWGKNDKGQLGVGDKDGRGIPTAVEFSGATVSDIKAGKDFSVLLTTDGRIFTWGNNSRGQLGVGDKAERLVPTEVTLDERISTINTNLTASNVVAITESGRLIVWGANDKAQLGNGSDWREEQRLEDERVENEKKAAAEADNVRKQGLVNECVVKAAEKWEKDNPPKRQKVEKPVEPEVEKEPTPTPTPTPTPRPSDDEDKEEKPDEPKEEDEYEWVQPTPPDFNADCLKEVEKDFKPTDTSGIVAKKIKEPELTPDSDKPLHIGGELRFIQASIGAQNGAAIGTEQKLYTWGTDDKGQNGNGIEDSKTHTQTPKKAQTADDYVTYVKAEVSNGWAMALTTESSINGWGSTTTDALAGAGSKQITPTLMAENMKDMYVGAATGYATSNENITYAWGGNTSGVLGIDSTITKSAELVEVGSGLVAVAPSGAAVISLGGNKNLYGWGTDRENAFGEGSANETVQPTARRLQQIAEFADVSVGDRFTVAVDTDGRVWVWGSNSAGIDGKQAGGNILYPVRVHTNSEAIVDVEAAGNAVYALSESGKMFMWGDGQTLTEMPLPAVPESLTAGERELNFLTESGELWHTGLSSSTQLMVGVPEEGEEAENAEIFVQIPGTYVNVSQSSSSQVIAQRDDLSFVTWGITEPEGMTEIEPGSNVFELDLSLPKIEHFSISDTHYVAFDVNRILWMWGEEPGGTFGSKGFVKTPQSSIFTPQKETSI